MEVLCIISITFLEKGHRQSDRYQNRLKVNAGQTSEIRGRAYFGFSGRIATVLNWTELNRYDPPLHGDTMFW